MDLSLSGHKLYIFLGNRVSINEASSSVCDIVSNGIVEKNAVLRHHTNPSSQLRER